MPHQAHRGINRDVCCGLCPFSVVYCVTVGKDNCFWVYMSLDDRELLPYVGEKVLSFLEILEIQQNVVTGKETACIYRILWGKDTSLGPWIVSTHSVSYSNNKWSLNPRIVGFRDIKGRHESCIYEAYSLEEEIYVAYLHLREQRGSIIYACQLY